MADWFSLAGEEPTVVVGAIRGILDNQNYTDLQRLQRIWRILQEWRGEASSKP